MSKRINISSGVPWGDTVGYSRAVRAGNTVFVSGTTSIEDGKVIFEGDFYMQTKTILQIIEKALRETGATKEDVVRTRIFVTDISKWEIVGKAHGEFFRNINPASTMVQVSGLVDLKMLVEIEAEAIIDEKP